MAYFNILGTTCLFEPIIGPKTLINILDSKRIPNIHFSTEN